MMLRIALVAGIVFAAYAGTALAAPNYSTTSSGYDISWPQCGHGYPSAPFGFGIVGVTNGRAFAVNPCFASEYNWAAASGTTPALYMNLNSPTGSDASESLTGPKGNCARRDKVCQSYNFGYNAAAAAFNYAGARATTNWWLDIETTNSWSADTALNDYVIQGAVDLFVSKSLSVGVYSTKRQWNTIAGTFFQPLPNLTNWVAGASSLSAAPYFCSSAFAFGGGTVSLVQYPSGSFSGDYVC